MTVNIKAEIEQILKDNTSDIFDERGWVVVADGIVEGDYQRVVDELLDLFRECGVKA